MKPFTGGQGSRWHTGRRNASARRTEARAAGRGEAAGVNQRD